MGKKILRFFGETFYELLLSKTLVFIVLPIISLAAWQLGDDELVPVFGMIAFYISLGAIMFCWLQGLFLRAVDKDLWQSLRNNAYGGKGFLRSKQGLYLCVAATILLLSTVAMLLSGENSPAPGLLVVLDVLAILYLALFIIGPERIKRILEKHKQ